MAGWLPLSARPSIIPAHRRVMQDRCYYIDNMRVHPVASGKAAIPGGEAILRWDAERRCPTLLIGQASVPLDSLEFVHPRSGLHQAIPMPWLEGLLRQGDQRLARAAAHAYDSRWEKLWNDVFPYPPEQLRLMQEANRDLVASLVRELGIGQDSRVLELACGHGWFADLMADHAGFVCATDLSLPPTIKANPNYHKVRFFVSDMLRLPKLRDRFDLIFQFACGAAERETDFGKPQWSDLAGTIHDLLKPGGHLYWIQMSNNSRKPSNAGFQVHLPASVLADQFFSRVGRIVRVRTLGYTSFLVRREGDQTAIAHSFPVAAELRMPGADRPAGMLAAVSEIGTVALRLFDRPLELSGDALATVPAYYVLRFIYNVPGPVFSRRIPSGSPERMSLRVFNGPGLVRSDQEYARWEREGADWEAKRFCRVRPLLMAGILFSRGTGCSDAAWVNIVRGVVSFASICRAVLRRLRSATSACLAARKLSQPSQGASRF